MVPIVVVVPVELRLPKRLEMDLGRGADNAVRYSKSLKSASPKSSASSELPPSNPAKRLLKRGGRFIGALWLERGPSSLPPGYIS
jgi:hypothetical protein